MLFRMDAAVYTIRRLMPFRRRYNYTTVKFCTCTVVSVNGTVVEDKMRRLGVNVHIFNKCPIYTHDGASAKFSTISHETDNSAV